MRQTTRALAFAAVGFLIPSVFAPPQALADDEWEVSVTPYLWLAGVEGDIGARPGVPPVDVDVGFEDIFDSLDGYFMGKLEVRHGRFGAFADFDYLEISGAHEVSLGSVLTASATTSIGATDATLAGYYRAYQDQQISVDLVGGARLTSLDFEVAGDINGAHFSGDLEKEWWDPVFGVRAHWQTEDRLGLTGYADYGGFGVSSDAVWQLYAAVDYQLTDAIALSAGYREYGVDFSDDDGTHYDVQLGGPLVGVRFTF